MGQNETLGGLSQAQFAALEALLAGKTLTEAARAASMGRATIYRWLKDDFAFQAELNRGRREIRRAALGNLERLAAKATGCLEKSIDEGDVKSALEVLKRMNILAPAQIGSDDPAELEAKAKREAKARNGNNQLLEMHAQIDACNPPRLT